MDNLYLAAICAVTPGLGRARLPALLQSLGGAQAVFNASCDRLTATGLVTPARAAKFIANRDQALPKKIESFCRREGVRLLTIFDDDYPQPLRTIHDAPPVLYVKGQIPDCSYAVGIVGSRAATAYGLRVAEYFSAALAREGVPIISGGARGIDTAAHTACLDAGGQTVAVLGCGLDQAYPPENYKLFQRIAAQGAVISEFAPGILPLPRNFPARNRIIAGLAQGILVAEAAKRSGAIITANVAADEGRDVFCVPDNIFDYTSIGCHELIRSGAKLVDTPQDILEERQSWQTVSPKSSQLDIFAFTEKEAKHEHTVAAAATELGKKLLQLLQGGAMTMEALVESSETDLAAVSMELLDLQVAGLVTVDQAQRYCRR